MVCGGGVFGPLNNITVEYYRTALTSRLHSGYTTVHHHLSRHFANPLFDQAAQLLR
ncbi:hypothetical protein Pcac1_g3110 [Phytophthora cactorum]|nr:hypothetical protein Pcac1_g3110 [Phytophthora cactorum]KAG2959784.1 hypothetical protein PC119_g26607 [Phytophthora cactorum]KAG2984367.1 hypothetical protein PC120_g24243 [Phytophthora cactorum]KAG3150748.1 hypothetical protein PC128_g23106 [Phytophthora cactorum]KAG4039609.1 hypothetical protein PC123_g24841 [Phytophthora cactorum]